MAIDTSIYQLARPQVELENPIQIATQMQQLRLQQANAAALNEQRQAMAEQRQQQAQAIAQQNADRQGFGQAMQAGGGVQDQTIQWAQQHAPNALPQLQKFFAETQESAAKVKKAQTDLRNIQLDHVGHIADGILQFAESNGGTPDVYKAALATGLATYHEQFPDEAGDTQAIAQRLQSLPPEQLKAALQQIRDASPYAQQAAAERAKLAPHAVGDSLVDPSGKVLYTAPQKTKPVYRVSPDKGTLEQVGELPANAQLVQEPQPPRVTVNTPGAQNGAGGLSSDGVEYAATEYRLTGKMPTFGMGGRGEKDAIVNAAARQAKEGGQTPAAAIQRQALYKADAGSLNKISVLQSTAEAAEQKALAQADIIAGLSDKVDRTKYPLINAAIMSGRTNIQGDSDATQLTNAINTFANEYAKIVEGSTGSVSGSSDAARRAAAKLITAKMSKGTLSDVVDLMKREMANTVSGYDFTKNKITERMGGQVPQSPAPQAAKDPLGIR